MNCAHPEAKARAIALHAAHLSLVPHLAGVLRAVIVSACALSLILAGNALPY